MSLTDLWNAAVAEAKVVEGEIVSGVRKAEEVVEPYVPSAMVSAAQSISQVGANAIDYVAGNPPGSLAKSGIAPLQQPGAPGLLSLKADLADFSASYRKLDAWKLTLGKERDMASKAGADKLVQAVDVWTSGASSAGLYQQANDALTRVLTLGQKLQGQLATGQPADPKDNTDYNNLRPGAVQAFEDADSYAKRIHDAIMAAVQKAASAGVPNAVDYVMAPVTGTVETGKKLATGVSKATKGAAKAVSGAVDYVESAGSSILKVAQAAGSGLTADLKYVAIGAAALGAIYLLTFVPRSPLRNRPRRRRAR